MCHRNFARVNAALQSISSFDNEALIYMYTVTSLKYVYYFHPAGEVTRVSVMPRKVTVKIGDAENRCR